jgi:hypothetical protein
MMVKIYCDSGADISSLKEFSHCEFYQFPYGSEHRPKKKFKLAKPSKTQWRDMHIPWNELNNVTWNDFSESDIFLQIMNIIGKSNRRDVLHIDSAYKTGCQIFLTSDKGDIISKRTEIESLCSIKIFHSPSEIEELKDRRIKKVHSTNI